MRYAVIDIDDGIARLAYIVGSRNSADGLCEPGGEVWPVKTPRGQFRCSNGIPVDDDGTPETGAAMADAIAKYRV